MLLSNTDIEMHVEQQLSTQEPLCTRSSGWVGSQATKKAGVDRMQILPLTAP